MKKASIFAGFSFLVAGTSKISNYEIIRDVEKVVDFLDRSYLKFRKVYFT